MNNDFTPKEYQDLLAEERKIHDEIQQEDENFVKNHYLFKALSSENKRLKEKNNQNLIKCLEVFIENSENNEDVGLASALLCSLCPESIDI